MSKRGQPNPLEEARIDVVRSAIAWHGVLTLSGANYKDLSERGLSRAAVDRAVNILVGRGDVILERHPLGVIVRLAGGGQ